MSESTYWQAIERRDRAFDGVFFYGVRSTGVFCLPSCASRQPRRENVSFFASAREAQQAGFRPCRRCHPQVDAAGDANLEIVRAICRYLEQPYEATPTLRDLGERFHLSSYHLQRVFKRAVGLSPRQYAAAQRAERLRRELRNGQSVTDAIYEAGYQSSGAVYDPQRDGLGMPPTVYRKGGAQQTISYTIAPCPLGSLLAAATPRGVCTVRLGDNADDLEAGLRREFPAAELRRDDALLAAWLAQLQDYLRGETTSPDLPLDVQATAFQWRVWRALRSIPYGETRSYSQVAAMIEQPTAVRAVANACAGNPAALVIPCHRVVRADGDLGGYRWGVARKRRLLEQEAKRR